MKIDLKGYEVIVLGLVIGGRLDEALEMRKEMEERETGFDLLDEMLGKRFAAGCICQCSGSSCGSTKHGLVQQAKEHFLKFRGSNEVSYSVLIDGLCKKGDRNDAERVFLEMEKTGLVPDKYCYTS
ncbi:hypothetical protein HPP92_004248 [Vanilla planifolia]|uniref:Pentatricopeptide repeat-containing protein n=1 Tax=Vanilla planifolia TaxID=51239 RepID=A0A835S8P7_VANPL|nr:hypothetical protein HPP92_004248 [Vanilla planifolia]